MKVYAALHRICHALDEQGDHAVAAHVSLAMCLLQQKHELDADECEDAVLQDAIERAAARPATDGFEGRT